MRAVKEYVEGNLQKKMKAEKDSGKKAVRQPSRKDLKEWNEYLSIQNRLKFDEIVALKKQLAEKETTCKRLSEDNLELRRRIQELQDFIKEVENTDAPMGRHWESLKKKYSVREIGERKRDSQDDTKTSLLGSQAIQSERERIKAAVSELANPEDGVSYYAKGWNSALKKVLEILEGKK